jgi:integrase
MASIVDYERGSFRIVFVNTAGARRSIRFQFKDPARVPDRKLRRELVSQTKMQIETIRFHIESIITATKKNKALSEETARWIDSSSEELQKKLIAAGLIAPTQPPAVTTLKTFLDAYLDDRAVKPATKTVQRLVIADLTTYFREGRDVRTITPGDADGFKEWLLGCKREKWRSSKRKSDPTEGGKPESTTGPTTPLKPTTVHKRLQVARSFFHAMLRRKLIDENPFEGVKVAPSGTRDRQRFVTRAETEKLLDACPDHDWRTIVALSRYGGLRCPSEVLSLRWEDVDWANDLIVVQSPKTEHHEGKATRTMPLFAELRRPLLEAAELAPRGAVYVVHERFRKGAQGPNGWKNSNLRTTFEKIIRRAGLTPWPRIFHNLRASRQTELTEKFPIQAVTDWLGNSPTIAMKHYLITTTEHFRAAVRGNDSTERGVAQNAARHDDRQPPESSTFGLKPVLARSNETARFPGFSEVCREIIAEEGFEPPTRGL